MAKASGTIKVNTQKVIGAANDLTAINNRLEKSFETVDNAVEALKNNWDGAASNKAISKYNQIKSSFLGDSGRYAVINNYVKFLKNAVATDYESTEKANTDLSSLFK